MSEKAMDSAAFFNQLDGLRRYLVEAVAWIDDLKNQHARFRPEKVEEETDDVLEYRKGRIADGPLSETGERVMYRLFAAGFTTEEISQRMKVSLLGVQGRMRKWKDAGRPLP